MGKKKVDSHKHPTMKMPAMSPAHKKAASRGMAKAMAAYMKGGRAK